MTHNWNTDAQKSQSEIKWVSATKKKKAAYHVLVAHGSFTADHDLASGVLFQLFCSHSTWSKNTANEIELCPSKLVDKCKGQRLKTIKIVVIRVNKKKKYLIRNKQKKNNYALEVIQTKLKFDQKKKKEKKNQFQTVTVNDEWLSTTVERLWSTSSNRKGDD